jgi:putative MATE family efflux protein
VTSRHRQILELGLPIILAQFSQSLISLVDTAMVAALDDTAALAAVGVGSYANFLAVSAVLGIAVGVQTLVARRLGAGEFDTLTEPLSGGLVLALLIGGGLGVLFWLAAPLLMSVYNDDPQVLAVSVEYFRYRTLSVALLGINFAFRGYWTGLRRSAVYMKILLAIQASNVFFSYGLIYGAFGMPALGASGSGLGSTLAVATGTLLYVATLFRLQAGGLAKPRPRTMGVIWRMALPSGMQQLLVALGMSVFYWLLGRISVEALAVGHAVLSVSLLVILPAHAFGMAATTLVSQSLGKADPRAALQWGWSSLRVAAPVLAVLGLPLLLAPDRIIALFIPSRPELFDMARLPLQISGAMAVLQAATQVLSQALLGAGDNRRVMLYALVLQWGYLLPAVAIGSLLFGLGLTGIWLIQLSERIISALVFTRRWHGERWQDNRL